MRCASLGGRGLESSRRAGSRTRFRARVSEGRPGHWTDQHARNGSNSSADTCRSSRVRSRAPRFMRWVPSTPRKLAAPAESAIAFAVNRRMGGTHRLEDRVLVVAAKVLDRISTEHVDVECSGHLVTQPLERNGRIHHALSHQGRGAFCAHGDARTRSALSLARPPR